MKITTKFLISFGVFTIFILPTFSFAQLGVGIPSETENQAIQQPAPQIEEEAVRPEREPAERKGLVQCGRKTIIKTEDIIDNDGKKVGTREYEILDPSDACNFDELMHLINNIINWILFGLAIPIAGIMFAYAGFTLITAGGDNAGARTKAKDIFLNAAIGLTLAFVAYILVKFILKTLGYSGAWIGF